MRIVMLAGLALMASGPAIEPGEFLRKAVVEGLKEDGADPAFVKASIADKRELFVLKCPICEPVRQGFAEYGAGKAAEPARGKGIPKDIVDDLKNPQSENLAAKHFDRRWIAHDQCYTCHTDYVWFGPLSAKTRGLRHLMAYYLAPEHRDIKLYEPFPNGNCLQCHGQARGYRENPVHEAAAAQIASGETRCPECHAPIHPTTAEESK